MAYRAAPQLAVEAGRRLADELRNRFGAGAVEVRLFGSYARGTAGEDSDVDVAVILPSVDWATRAEVIDLASDIGREVDLLLSATVFDRQTFAAWRAQQRPLAMDIEHEGVEL